MTTLISPGPIEELAELRRSRAELAADVAANVAGADPANLVDLEARIRVLEVDVERAELAREVLERRDRDAEVAAETARRASVEQEIARLESERDELIGRAVTSAAESARLAAGAVTVDDRIELSRRSLDQGHRSLRTGMLGDRLALEFSNAGVDGGFEPTTESWRRVLVERWPAVEAEREQVALCTVCSHAERGQIDEALATPGNTLRTLEVQFGVSRSALSRHRAHSAT